MGAFQQNLLPVPAPCHTMEIQCLGEGQLLVSMHKGTVTSSIIREVSSKLEQE